jgi:YHS domain-containing protein
VNKNVKALVAAMTIVASLIVFAGCEKEPVAQKPVKETASAAEVSGTQDEAIVQTTCPVMEGNPIDKTLFVEYKGKKVYFCCIGCPEKFLADPEKYVAKLPQFKQ